MLYLCQSLLYPFFMFLLNQIHGTLSTPSKLLELRYHIHASFMSLSWQITGSFPKATKLYSYQIQKLSWQIHVAFMWLSLKLQNVEYHMQISFIMVDSWHFHGTFMALSWQIHGTFPKVNKNLGFMSLSWRIHDAFPKSSKINTIIKKIYSYISI